MLLYAPGWIVDSRAPGGRIWAREYRKKKSRIRTGMEKDGISSFGAADSSGKTKRRLWMESQFELIEAQRKAG